MKGNEFVWSLICEISDLLPGHLFLNLMYQSASLDKLNMEVGLSLGEAFIRVLLAMDDFSVWLSSAWRSFFC